MTFTILRMPPSNSKNLLCHGVILIALNVYSPAVANPVQLELNPRDNSFNNPDDSNSILSPKAWIPIVVVVVLLTLIAFLSWSKNSFANSFQKIFRLCRVYDSRSRRPATSMQRELTAEQLVGSDTATNLPTTRQPRRTRRPRRTPSQISVTSLPAYNKEPGEEELVIFRGRDMEDASATVVEEEEDSSLHSRDRSQVSRYTPVPTTNNEMPLLDDGHPSGDLSLSTILSHARRPSSDSSLQETSSLMRVDSNVPDGSADPRGEAPAYFEVVDLTQEPNSGVPTTQTSSVPSSTSISPEPQPRRSGFRSFFNRMSMTSHVPEHRRTGSDQSFSSNGHRPHRSTPNRTHRTSQSSSGPSMFRTLSRQRSIQTLNSSVHLDSPSVISLNSISSPLAHTLVRTEFTYPKSGPTPEQLKVISSRENFSRFGMPYGADAIAFAASSSRQDLEPPPPGFEASLSQLSLVRPGPSRRLDSSVGDAPSRPIISDLALEGQGADHGDGPQSSEAQPSVDRQSENVPNMSTSSTTHTETSASSSTSKAPASPTNPSVSSTSTRSIPPLLPPITEFGKLNFSSLTPKDAASRTESRGSNSSLQSYATAPDMADDGRNEG